MSLDMNYGVTAKGSSSLNDGIHKLPKDCYPPTDSESEDGEESFVVLNDPGSSFIGVVETFQPNAPSPGSLPSYDTIERSLNVLNDIAQSSILGHSNNQESLINNSKNNLNEPSLQSLNSMSAFVQSVGARESGGVNNVNTHELNLSLIQSRVQMYSFENTQLKEAVKQNNIAMEDQCRKIVQLQDKHKSAIAQGMTNLQQALKEVQQLKTENQELIFVRDEQKKVISQLQTDIILVNKNNAQLQASKKAVDNMSVANMRSFELEAAEKKLAETMILLQTDVEKRNELQAELNIVGTQLEASKYKHLEDIARLKEKLFYFEGRENVYKQNEIVQKTMTAQMSEMQMNIVEMTTRMNDLMTKNCILDEQLKIYKADFEEEREARQTLKQNENQLKDDLKFTRDLNEELKVENARLKTSNAGVASPTIAAASQVYVCHWCQFGFFSFNALQNHNERCPEAFEHV